MAALVVQLVLHRADDLQQFLLQLVSASGLGIYYYIFRIFCLIPLIWPLSRLSRPAVTGLWAASVVLCGVLVWRPELGWSDSMHWRMRDPLQDFTLGYFMTGWVVALWRRELVTLARRQSVWLVMVALATVVAGWVSFYGSSPLSPGLRIVYTFSVIGLVVWLSHDRPVPVWVRFLSDASLGIYLYHRVFMMVAKLWTNDLPDLPRIGVQVAVGLGMSSVLLLLARRALGRERAARWLGA
jgi:peptidoglycan/LPS O-acetylase OafA/YrhL